MTHDTEHDRKGLTRRDSLLTLGGLAATVGAGAWGSGLLGDDDVEAAGAGPAAVPSGLVTCVAAGAHGGAVLRPERAVAPGHHGGQAGNGAAPRAEGGRTRRPAARSATPLSTSGTATRSACTRARSRTSPGTNFLRGVQRTNAKGIATFRTIYPGWYPGRAVHIHVKVHVGGDVVHAGQLFFPACRLERRLPAEPLPQPRHAGGHPERHRRDLPQRREQGMLTMKKSGTGYVGSVSMGVQVA